MLAAVSFEDPIRLSALFDAASVVIRTQHPASFLPFAAKVQLLAHPMLQSSAYLLSPTIFFSSAAFDSDAWMRPLPPNELTPTSHLDIVTLCPHGRASTNSFEIHNRPISVIAHNPPCCETPPRLRSELLWGLRGPTLFPDHFQLGGPASVHAFCPNGLGPRDESDAVGGEVYWAAGLSVVAPIPGKPEWPVKTHMWVNAGVRSPFLLCEYIVLTTHPAAARTLLTRPSISAGVGLTCAFDPARIELNFGLPLTVSKGEGGRRGDELGVGWLWLTGLAYRGGCGGCGPAEENMCGA
ncbi:hypothetical protein DFH09DRAFT_1474752 [Mycena vulgaris]|nr:hypothetical protein DFH09DRAFT_1474752 [Mycena vulgaris]